MCYKNKSNKKSFKFGKENPIANNLTVEDYQMNVLTNLSSKSSDTVSVKPLFRNVRATSRYESLGVLSYKTFLKQTFHQMIEEEKISEFVTWKQNEDSINEWIKKNKDIAQREEEMKRIEEASNEFWNFCLEYRI